MHRFERTVSAAPGIYDIRGGADLMPYLCAREPLARARRAVDTLVYLVVHIGFLVFVFLYIVLSGAEPHLETPF